jgi:hypothetical protein
VAFSPFQYGTENEQRTMDTQPTLQDVPVSPNFFFRFEAKRKRAAFLLSEAKTSGAPCIWTLKMYFVRLKNLMWVSKYAEAITKFFLREYINIL